MYEDIREQFKSVIRYSQNIPEPKIDYLFINLSKIGNFQAFLQAETEKSRNTLQLVQTDTHQCIRPEII